MTRLKVLLDKALCPNDWIYTFTCVAHTWSMCCSDDRGGHRCTARLSSVWWDEWQLLELWLWLIHFTTWVYIHTETAIHIFLKSDTCWWRVRVTVHFKHSFKVIFCITIFSSKHSPVDPVCKNNLTVLQAKGDWSVQTISSRKPSQSNIGCYYYYCYCYGCDAAVFISYLGALQGSLWADKL